MKKIAKQMSESIELGIVLAASGGFMDAYSYIMRDHLRLELCWLIWCVFGWMRKKGFTGGRFLYC